MTDRIDSSGEQARRGPWPEYRNAEQDYDHGRRWCVNADGHPGDDGYPDPDVHVPWHECRGVAAWLDGARRDLDGEPLEMSVYLAAPFRFGQPRSSTADPTTRLVIDACGADDRDAVRLSIDLGEATRLARILNRLVDSVSLPDFAA